MFSSPPREPEWLSWLFVGLWTLFIYACIPYVGALVRYVSQIIPRESFIFGVGIIGLGFSALAIRSLRRRPEVGIANYLWLIAATAAFIAYTASLRTNPEEAVHFVEYGVLGLLLFRAFSQRVRDTGVYALAAITGAIIGMLDEAIQWLVPGRVWDVRDIILNTSAVALVQILIWQGLRSPIITRAPDGRRARQICRFAAFALFLIGLCLINTPQRIAWYAERFEPLSYLGQPSGTMIEYGHLIEDPSTGAFRSRLTPEELHSEDEARAVEGAAVLDRFADDESYGAFLSEHTAAKDPFLHEARVHLFRRDRYLSRAEEAENEDSRRSYMTVAFRENRIMERYFPGVLSHSGYVWGPDLEARIEQEANRDEPYESAVSRNVVTHFNEREAIWFVIAGIVVLLVVGEICARRSAPRS